MFTTFKYRRQIAVLVALAMVASVLVAAPAVAADDDPKADYTADFSACIGDAGDSSGFEDVPASHASAGSIDCIAYYGITQGTSATTYSPSMSVTREHMALFLTRLAALVGIEMASDPADAGFEDISELSAESQTAINQLADLGITQGTSETTYSPADAVTRGHMALFISRLMDNMTPIGGDDSAWGHTPSDVVEDEANDIAVGSPFTDLGSVTKSTYDAITALWELGVASGINATSYAPQASITRAAMADFMAGVLNHSNARPAGVSMQAEDTEALGSVTADIVVSYRDDSFTPMVDISLAIFTASDASGTGNSPFSDTGKCTSESACEWTDSDFLTNAAGNYVVEGASIATTNAAGDGTGNLMNSETWYAWVGDEDNTDFVMGSSGEASVTLTANPNALGIRVTTDLNANASTVHYGKDQSVVITAQLVDEVSTSTTIADANAVPKAGVSLAVTYLIGGTAANPAPDPVKTDADGMATFTITHPGDEDDETDDDNRNDTVTFSGNVDDDEGDTAETGQIVVVWSDDAPAISSSSSSVDSPYAVVDDDEVSIRATVSYFDQFGNGDAQGEDVTVTFTSTNTGAGNVQAKTVEVRSNGSVSTRGVVTAEPGNTVAVTFSDVGGQTGTERSVIAVEHANKRDITTAATAVTVYADDDRFRYTADDADSGAETGDLYSYDGDDVYILDGQSSDMDAFETAIKGGAHVQVVVYSPDGASIFSAESQ